MRIPADVFETVNDFSLQFDKWLNSNFIDLFEGFSIDILEILSLKLFYEFGVGTLHVGFSDDAVLI